MNYYRLHIGDYLRDTAHLSLLEHGVYARLLQVYYTREAAIPDTEKYRVVGARAPDERDAVDAVLREFFVLTDAGWTQSRCDREIAEYQAKAERNREVGRLGGRPVKPRNPEETQTVSTVNPTETLANSQEPIASKEQEKESARNRAPAARGSRIPEGFPGEDEIAWCRAQRPELDARRVAQVFRDHALANGRALRDWRAGWRAWVGKERAPPRAVTRASPLETQAEILHRITGGLHGRPSIDPRTIDVDTEPAPRLAIGSR
jgi:uncharacterized protein YdaU (DUF1376 family)